MRALRIYSYFLAVFVFCISCSSGIRSRTAPYNIARSSSWERLNLYGVDNNILGFSEDFFLEIARREKIDIRLISSNELPLTSLLEQNDIDGIITTLEPTEQNSRDYVFSEPYFVMGPILVVRVDAPYRSLQDLEAKDIGFDRNELAGYQLNEEINANFLPYDDIIRAVEDLGRHRLDGVVVDAIIAYRLAAGMYQGSIRVVPPPLKPIAFRLVVKKGKNEELIALFNKELQEMKKSGLYDKMLLYWSLFNAQGQRE